MIDIVIDADTTDRQVFDAIVRALLAQGGPSRDSVNGLCRYRGAHGRACAVGQVITDSAYTPFVEGEVLPLVGVKEDTCWYARSNAGGDHIAKALNDSGLPPRESLRLLLLELQGAHDGAARVTAIALINLGTPESVGWHAALEERLPCFGFDSGTGAFTGQVIE